MNNLFFLLVFIVLSAIFAIASIISALFVGYHSDDVDDSIYECGMKLFNDAKIQFDVKFLKFALMFLIFDVETIFLFPFAVSVNEVNLYVLIEIIIFVLMLLFTLFYAIRKNILRWQ
ncbi:NADH-quinone oxidoreductase subunit A [bacterium]|nr:NADH-quinone oxidoreductase subunit A [bacterium]